MTSSEVVSVLCVDDSEQAWLTVPALCHAEMFNLNSLCILPSKLVCIHKEVHNYHRSSTNVET